VSDETADRGQPRAATGWGLAASAYVFTVVMMGTTLRLSRRCNRIRA